MATIIRPHGEAHEEAGLDGLQERRGRIAGWVVPVAILVIATLAVFGWTIPNSFVNWDDSIHVYENSHIVNREGVHVEYFWTHQYQGMYIPISYTVFAFIVLLTSQRLGIAGMVLHPYAFHAVSVALHTVNALIVFAIFRRFTKRDWPSLIGALIFAIHPFQVESVAWASELRGMLAGAFGLSAVYLYLNAASDPAVGERIPVRKWGYWLALILTAAALLSKPSAAAIPVSLVILDHWALRRSLKISILSVLPWVAAVLPFYIITSHVQPISAHDSGPIWGRPFIAGDALAFYMGRFLVPWGFCIDHGRKPPLVLSHWWGYVTWVAPAALAALVYALRKERPYLVTGSLFALGNLLPVLGLAPFIFQCFSTVADRYVYMSMIGVGLVAAHLLAENERARSIKAWYALAAVVLAVWGVICVIQIRHWKNALTLFAYTVQTNPNSAGMRCNYGLDLDSVGRYNEAIDQLRAAIALDPTSPQNYVNLGDTFRHAGRVQDAIDLYAYVVQNDPKFVPARQKLGVLWIDTGRAAQAAALMVDTLTIAPNDANVHCTYASALFQLGNIEQAAEEYKTALQLDPDTEHALWGLGTVQAQMGLRTEAESNIRQAIALTPKDPEAHAAYAWLLESERRIPEAMREYRLAISLDPHNDRIHHNFGMCLFDNGDRPGGVAELRQAVACAQNPINLDTLGVAYMMVGDGPDAQQYLSAAFELDPTSPLIRKHLDALQRH